MTRVVDLPDDLHAPVWLDALVDADGALPRGAVAAAVLDHDVVVGRLLDEELVALAPDPGPGPEVTPWLAARDAGERAVAHEVVERLQAAFGVVVDAGAGGAEVTLDLAVVADALARADRWVELTAPDGAVVGRVGQLVDAPGVWLHDRREPDGVHLLVLRSGERARRVAPARDDVLG